MRRLEIFFLGQSGSHFEAAIATDKNCPKIFRRRQEQEWDKSRNEVSSYYVYTFEYQEKEDKEKLIQMALEACSRYNTKPKLFDATINLVNPDTYLNKETEDAI